jgi:hypothetical protein
MREPAPSEDGGGKTDSPMTELRRVRSDTLPENTTYRDDGCDVHARCLTCPLPACRYDVQGGKRELLNMYRDQQIAFLKHSGLTGARIAKLLGVSRRTVVRVGR